MTSNWDSANWKTSSKVVIGLITIWPVIYIGLFVVLAFSGVLFSVVFSEPERQSSRLDLIQLERKIQNGDVKELKATSRLIRATDRNGRTFETSVDDDSTREEILRLAREGDANGKPRVEKIEEKYSESTVERAFPIGIIVFFALHLFTILLMFVLMPLYIILAVKNERLDQTMRIVWVVLACTVGMFANIVYWYLYIWRLPSAKGNPSSPAQTPVTT